VSSIASALDLACSSAKPRSLLRFREGSVSHRQLLTGTADARPLELAAALGREQRAGLCHLLDELAHLRHALLGRGSLVSLFGRSIRNRIVVFPLVWINMPPLARAAFSSACLSSALAPRRNHPPEHLADFNFGFGAGIGWECA